VHYEIFKNGKIVPSKLSFSDGDDDKTIGRIPIRAIAPPHTIDTLKKVILRSEGIDYRTSAVDIFSGTAKDNDEPFYSISSFGAGEEWQSPQGCASIAYPLAVVVDTTEVGSDGCAYPIPVGGTPRELGSRVFVDTNKRPIGWMSATSTHCEHFHFL
jgi:hypothetical protein